MTENHILASYLETKPIKYSRQFILIALMQLLINSVIGIYVKLPIDFLFPLDNELSMALSAVVVILMYIITRYIFRAITGHSLKYDDPEKRLVYYAKATKITMLFLIVTALPLLVVLLFGTTIVGLIGTAAASIITILYYPTADRLKQHLEIKTT